MLATREEPGGGSPGIFPWYPLFWAAENFNIVFNIVDDFGWADAAFHGGEVPTPHRDRLSPDVVELTRY